MSYLSPQLIPKFPIALIRVLSTRVYTYKKREGIMSKGSSRKEEETNGGKYNTKTAQSTRSNYKRKGKEKPSSRGR